MNTTTPFAEAARRRPLLGFVTTFASPGLVERMAQDWEWCWIDTQHGQWHTHDAVDAVRACERAGVYTMVRVPGHEAGTIGKVLDTACDAVMAPMVNSRADAEALVRAAKFAPLGRRSYGGRRPYDTLGGAYANPDQPQPLLACQIETPEALEVVEDIAAVDGVDALVFGPDDMALARGMRMGEPRAPDAFAKESARIVSAAHAHGALAVCILGSAEATATAIATGYDLIACTADARLIGRGSGEDAAAARAARERKA